MRQLNRLLFLCKFLTNPNFLWVGFLIGKINLKIKKVRKIVMMLCTYFAGRANTTICEFVCDTVEELMNDAPTTTKKGTGNF